MSSGAALDPGSHHGPNRSIDLSGQRNIRVPHVPSAAEVIADLIATEALSDGRFEVVRQLRTPVIHTDQRGQQTVVWALTGLRCLKDMTLHLHRCGLGEHLPAAERAMLAHRLRNPARRVKIGGELWPAMKVISHLGLRYHERLQKKLGKLPTPSRSAGAGQEATPATHTSSHAPQERT